MSVHSDRVVVTMSHTIGNRTDLAYYLLNHGATHVISTIEYHGGTKKNMERRMKLDPTDKDYLAEGEEYHLCAVAFGKFHKTNLAKRGRTWAQKKYGNPEQCWSTLFCHVNKTKSGKVSYSRWPLADMVAYVTEPSEKKDVDLEPLVCTVTDKSETIKNKKQLQLVSVDSLLETYEQQSDMFSAIRDLKRKGIQQGPLIEELMDRTEQDTQKVNIFLQYFRSIDVSELPKLLPEGLILRPWQSTIIQWCNNPIVKGEPNGMWLNLKSGMGKTTILQALYDTMGVENIYQMSTRSGGYDSISMLAYNDEPIILIDELEFHIDDNGTARPKSSLKEILKKITEKFPISIQFGMKRRCVIPQAKVIITSNHPLIEDPDVHGACPFARRYISVQDTNFLPEMLGIETSKSEGE